MSREAVELTPSEDGSTCHPASKYDFLGQQLEKDGRCWLQIVWQFRDSSLHEFMDFSHQFQPIHSGSEIDKVHRTRPPTNCCEARLKRVLSMRSKGCYLLPIPCLKGASESTLVIMAKASILVRPKPVFLCSHEKKEPMDHPPLKKFPRPTPPPPMEDQRLQFRGLRFTRKPEDQSEPHSGVEYLAHRWPRHGNDSYGHNSLHQAPQ